MQVASSGGLICNLCKWCYVVAKFYPSHGVNFWVLCASGNVFVFLDGETFVFPLLFSQLLARVEWALVLKSDDFREIERTTSGWLTQRTQKQSSLPKLNLSD